MDGTPSNAQSWLDWAQSSRDDGGLGLAPHQAAGLVGNLQAESGAALKSWGPTGDSGSAWGTAQWRNERLDGLKKLSADNGTDYRSVEAQQAWMRHEMDTTHSSAYKALTASSSPEEAARAVNRLYEISADKTGNREANARAIMDGNLGGGSPDAGGALSYASTGKGARSVPALSPDNTMGPGALTDQGVTAAQPENPWSRRADALAQIGASLASINSPSQAYALNSMIAQNKKTPKDQGTWSSHVMPNGQVMQTNSLTGQTRTLPGNYAAPSDTAAADQSPQMIPTWGDAKLLGDGTKPLTPDQESAFYSSMNPQQAEMTKAIVENRLPPPTAAAMSRKDSPYPAAFAAAAKIDPSVDSTVYGARIAGQKDWATKGAESARALNQTIAHQSEALVGAMKGLDNGDTPIFNKVANLWSENVSGSGKVPAFRTAAHAVVDELAKTFKQNNLSDTEIRKWEENLPASMSPEQQRSQIRTFQTLMSGAMSSLDDKRRLAIGKRAADKADPLLSDRGREGLAKLQEFATEPAQAAPAPTPAAPAAPAPKPADKRRPLGTFFN